MNWEYFILGIIFYQICKMLILIIRNALKERREKQFLKFISIRFPDSDITFISIDSSDRQAMENLQKEIYTHYELYEDSPKERVNGHSPKVKYYE